MDDSGARADDDDRDLSTALDPADSAAWDLLGVLDRTYFDAARRLFDYPNERRALSFKDRVLVELALHATVTQIDEEQLERTIRRAAEIGVTCDEVVCVLELVAVLGLHSSSVGMPVLREELDAAGALPPPTSHHEHVKRQFETAGPRPRPVDAMFGSMLDLDVEYFERFAAFVDVPWREDVLDPCVKHLVQLAIDVTCTHLYVDGIRRHVREALAVGATAAQILEVIQLASTIGLQTLRVGVPIAAEVFSQQEPQPLGPA